MTMSFKFPERTYRRITSVLSEVWSFLLSLFQSHFAFSFLYVEADCVMKIPIEYILEASSKIYISHHSFQDTDLRRKKLLPLFMLSSVRAV